MHWAIRVKKEPMLEASKVEPPATSQAGFNADEEPPKISSREAASPSSKPGKNFLNIMKSLHSYDPLKFKCLNTKH